MKSLKIILPIGLCAVVVTGIVTNKSRVEANKKLEHEEMLVAIRNRAVLSDQEAHRKFDEERRQAQENRGLLRILGMEQLAE